MASASSSGEQAGYIKAKPRAAVSKPVVKVHGGTLRSSKGRVLREPSVKNGREEVKASAPTLEVGKKAEVGITDKIGVGGGDLGERKMTEAAFQKFPT